VRGTIGRTFGRTEPLPAGPWRLEGSLGLERIGSARNVVDAADFRPVRPVAEGVAVTAELLASVGDGVGAVDGWGARLRLHGVGRSGVDDASDPDDSRPREQLGHVATELRIGWGRTGAWRALDVTLDLRAGAAVDAPPHALYLLGGRGTLLGHPYREQVGDRYWWGELQLGRELVAPWVGLRATAAAGRSWLVDRELPAAWPGRGDAPALGSLGVGVSLFWDVLHVDVARGVGPGGDWGVALGVAPRFRDWL
jgi:hypothetical protein